MGRNREPLEFVTLQHLNPVSRILSAPSALGAVLLLPVLSWFYIHCDVTRCQNKTSVIVSSAKMQWRGVSDVNVEC